MLSEGIKHTRCFIGMALMGVVICILSYYIGVYQGDVHVANTVQSFTEGQNEDLKETIKAYEEQTQYFQFMMSRSVVMPQDTTISVKQGTIIIPPMPQGTEKELSE